MPSFSLWTFWSILFLLEDMNLGHSRSLLMTIPCCSWHNLTTWMDCCEVCLLPSAGWGCNVCRQWHAVIMAAVMRHSNPICLIFHKWSSQLEVFPNYLTTISLTTRLILLFLSESCRWSWLPSKCTQAFMDFCDSQDDLFPTTIGYP